MIVLAGIDGPNPNDYHSRDRKGGRASREIPLSFEAVRALFAKGCQANFAGQDGNF